MIELYQTEWCPASHRVRQRLTELEVDYIARQVPVSREERTALRASTGADSIPALVTEEGDAIVGEEAILEYLGERFDESERAEEHRVKAARVRRRDLEEACA